MKINMTTQSRRMTAAPTYFTLLSTPEPATFPRASANTSGGISRIASHSPPGVMMRSSS